MDNLQFTVKHFATGISGGAGFAAKRTHECLAGVGVLSEFVTPERSLFRVGEIGKNFSKVFVSDLLTLGQKVFLQSGPGLMTTLSSDFYKNLPSDKSLVHVHAFYNLFSMNSLLALVDRGPIIVTMHDQRLITGGCHYSRDCRGYVDSCSSCPQARRLTWPLVASAKRKSNELLQNKNLRVVAPSKWIANMVYENNPTLTSTVSVIRNPIPDPTTKFSRTHLRAKLRLGSTDFVVGFVSTRLDNPLKGGADLHYAIELLPKERKQALKLLLVGEGGFQSKSLGDYVVQTSKHEELRVEDYLLAMDVLIVPSVEDNMPNVIGESLMVGTPVIGSNVGGIPEILKDFNMPIVSPNSPAHLAQELTDWQPIWNRDDIISKAQSTFGYKVIGGQLRELYEGVINSIRK